MLVLSFFITSMLSKFRDYEVKNLSTVNNSEESNETSAMPNIIYHFKLALLHNILDVVRWLFMVWLGANMSRDLHNRLLNRVMKAPVNLYFDVTPLGKLTKHFTYDIGRCDRAFFWHINWVFESVTDCLIKICIAVYFSAWMGVVVVINMFMLYRV